MSWWTNTSPAERYLSPEEGCRASLARWDAEHRAPERRAATVPAPELRTSPVDEWRGSTGHPYAEVTVAQATRAESSAAVWAGRIALAELGLSRLGVRYFASLDDPRAAQAKRFYDHRDLDGLVLPTVYPDDVLVRVGGGRDRDAIAAVVWHEARHLWQRQTWGAALTADDKEEADARAFSDRMTAKYRLRRHGEQRWRLSF